MNLARAADDTPPSGSDDRPPSGSDVEKIGSVVRMLASAMLGAQETRIVRFTAVNEGKVRWQVEVEAFIPNPELTVVNRGETREILERRHCRFDLDYFMELVSFAPIDMP